MKALLLLFFLFLIDSQNIPTPFPYPPPIYSPPSRASPTPPQKLNYDPNSFSYNRNERAISVDDNQGLPNNVSPRRSQNLNLEYRSDAKNLRSLPFIHHDNSIDLSTGITCQTLKHFAFRTGTNNDAPKIYLTASGCGTGVINFKASSGPDGRPGDNQLWVSYQRSDKSWIFESKICSNYFIRSTSLTQIYLDYGAFMSSTFQIQYHQDHEHIQSHFYQSNYWALQSPLILSAGSSRYIVEFWPQFEWGK